jgi:WD40 repeat protein
MLLICCSTVGAYSVNGQCNISIDDLTVSSDGAFIAVYDSTSKLIQIFSTTTFSSVKTIEPSQDYVSDITFSKHGKFLLWADSTFGDGSRIYSKVHFYDLEEGLQTITIDNGASTAVNLEFSEDSGLLYLLGKYDGYERVDIQVWDVEKEMILAFMEAWNILPVYPRESMTFYLATKLSLGITDEFSYQIETWDAQSDVVIRSIELLSPATAITTNVDETIIVSSDVDGLISFWDADTGTEILSWETDLALINRLAFTHDGHLMTISSNDDESVVAIWEIEPEPEAIATISFEDDIVVEFDNLTNYKMYIGGDGISSSPLVLWEYLDNSVEPVALSC